MIDLITPRLRLIPLNLAQIEDYLHNPGQLEHQLGFAVSQTSLTPPLISALTIKAEKMRTTPESEHPWYTYWLMVIRDMPFGAGMAGFKGLPDDLGQVEIGYGIDSEYEGKGYTTEAVRALVAWAFEQPACQAVIAETNRENIASHRVLEKGGFQANGETADGLRWQIDRTSPWVG